MSQPNTMRPLSQMEIVKALEELGQQAHRLRSADRHDAEAFVSDKSELVSNIYRLRDHVRLGTRGDLRCDQD